MTNDTNQKIIALVGKEFNKDAIECACTTAFFETLPENKEQLALMMSNCMLAFIATKVCEERLIIKRKGAL